AASRPRRKRGVPVCGQRVLPRRQLSQVPQKEPSLRLRNAAERPRYRALSILSRESNSISLAPCWDWRRWSSPQALSSVMSLIPAVEQRRSLLLLSCRLPTRVAIRIWNIYPTELAKASSILFRNFLN